MSNVIDYTNYYSNWSWSNTKIIKAQGKGYNFLMLRKLKYPIRRFDGKKASYELI